MVPWRKLYGSGSKSILSSLLVPETFAQHCIKLIFAIYLDSVVYESNVYGLTQVCQ